MYLVTGSTGLVGAHLLYELVCEGYPVKALARKSSNRNRVLETFGYYSDHANELYARINWVEGDVDDIISLEDAFDGVTNVFHTAALVTFNPYEKQKIIDVNVNGTANIVNLCLEKNITKLCYVSSIAALGTTEDGSAIHEDVLWKPVKNESAYSLSKYQAEMEVWRGITEGLNAVIVNPSVILGPGNWEKSSASIVNTVARGFKFYTTGITGFVDVRDVAFAMVALMQNSASGERFILNSENICFKDLFEMIADGLHVKRPSVEIPQWLSGLAYYVEMLKANLLRVPPRVSKSTVHSLYQHHYYSSDKVKNKLQLEFRSLKETVRDLATLYIETHTK